MDLVAIMMDDIEKAREARIECTKMAEDGLITLADAVVVHKDLRGEVQLDQAVNLTVGGAFGGAWWGLLIGAIAGIATGTAGLSLAGLAGGAAGGALGGWLSDAGISDEMMKKTGDALDNGKAILFLLGRTGAPDKALERLKPFGGEVVTSNLPAEVDEQINAALAKTTA